MVNENVKDIKIEIVLDNDKSLKSNITPQLVEHLSEEQLGGLLRQLVVQAQKEYDLQN